MKNLSEKELKNIKGGVSITSSLINSVVNLIEILLDAGRILGTSITRIRNDKICPLN